LVTEEDQSLVDALCADTGLSPPDKLLDESKGRDVARTLQLERNLEREVADMEAEISLIERQIEVKNKQLGVIEDALVVCQHKEGEANAIDDKKVSEAWVMSERAALYMD
jgi:hypothetical protein